MVTTSHIMGRINSHMIMVGWFPGTEVIHITLGATGLVSSTNVHKVKKHMQALVVLAYSPSLVIIKNIRILSSEPIIGVFNP